jgi:hypothetical protein
MVDFMKILKLLKLSEDYYHKPLDDVPANLPVFPKDCSIRIGTMDAIEIYGSREFTGWEVYGVIENGVCVAYIIISEKEFGDKTHHFREIWVTPELRGRGRIIDRNQMRVRLKKSIQLFITN